MTNYLTEPERISRVEMREDRTELEQVADTLKFCQEQLELCAKTVERHEDELVNELGKGFTVFHIRAAKARIGIALSKLLANGIWPVSK